MKIVVSGYIGKKVTGIGRNLICLLNNSKSNIEYVIYTNIDMKKELFFTNSNVTVKTYNVSKNDSFKNLLWTTFIFPFKVLQEKADKALIPNFTLLLFKFKPTVVIMHDLIEFNVPDKFSKKKMFYRTKLADPITAKLADKIITVSENSKRDIIKFLKVNKDKIKVIYNGVDTDTFKKMDKSESQQIFKKRDWPSDYILYAGTIDHPGKNAITIVKAFERLKEHQEYLGKLILAGMPGAGYDILKLYIDKSKWKNDIILTGYVTDKELVALYSNCRVFCFVSLYEGFGIPPLEALACRAKVIVSNTSSLPEVVGNVGYKVNPVSIEDLRKKIVFVLEQLEDDMELQEKVNNHLIKFKWDVLSEKFEKYLCK